MIKRRPEEALDSVTATELLYAKRTCINGGVTALSLEMLQCLRVVFLIN